MSVRSRRLAVAAAIAATAITVPAAALASSSGTPSGKPSPSAAASQPAASKSPMTGQPATAGGAAAAKKSAARQPGSIDSMTGPAMVAALAARLGVSHSAAQRAFNQLDALNGPGGVDPASPAFAAIARDLGVSPAQLAAALATAKQAARQSVAGS